MDTQNRPDKSYHFEQEIKRFADSIESIQKDISDVKIDVAVIKNHHKEIKKINTINNPTKPAGIGGMVGGLVATITAVVHYYFTRN